MTVLYAFAGSNVGIPFNALHEFCTFYKGVIKQAEFIYTRTIEILVATLVGAFLCWLGYRLFYRGLSDKSDLKLELLS